MRGVVQSFDPDKGIGIICGQDGDRYPVTRADIQRLETLAIGQRVYFSVRFVNNHAFATNVGKLKPSQKKALND